MPRKDRAKNTETKELVIYQDKTGKIEFRGDFKNDTIWDDINQVASLFGVQKAAISKHLKNTYKDKELDRGPTVSKMEMVRVKFSQTTDREMFTTRRIA